MPNNDIPSQIAELESSLAQPMPQAVHRLVEQQLATLRQQRAALVDLGNAQTGDVSVGDVAGRDVLKGSVEDSGAVHGAAVLGVNQGVVINAQAFSSSPDATQLRLLRAIAEQTGGEDRAACLMSSTPAVVELGLTLRDVADDLCILEDLGYVAFPFKNQTDGYTVALTPYKGM
jgi:hypothetical protein